MKWWIEKQCAQQHVHGIFAAYGKKKLSRWKNLIVENSWSEILLIGFLWFLMGRKFSPYAWTQNFYYRELYITNKSVKTRETIILGFFVYERVEILFNGIFINDNRHLERDPIANFLWLFLTDSYSQITEGFKKSLEEAWLKVAVENLGHNLECKMMFGLQDVLLAYLVNTEFCLPFVVCVL